MSAPLNKPQTKLYRDFLKLSGRWGGWGDPRKLKVIGRRMVRRVARVKLRTTTEI